MAEDERDRKLDAMLDSLLSAYSVAEPRAGLEMRIRATLNARAAHRRRAWMLAFAAGAAAVLITMIWQPRTSPRPNAPDHAAVSTIPPSPVLVLETVPSSHHSKTVKRITPGWHPDDPAGGSSQLLLQAVNSMPSADNLALQHERLYLKPAPQPEPEPEPEPPVSAPSIVIQDLGVRSIEIKELPSEIKELPSANNADSKGTKR